MLKMLQFFSFKIWLFPSMYRETLSIFDIKRNIQILYELLQFYKRKQSI